MHISFEINLLTILMVVFILIAIVCFIVDVIKSEGGELFLGIAIISLGCAAACGFSDYAFNAAKDYKDKAIKIVEDLEKKEKEEKEETLKKGIETDALIVDKEEYESDIPGSVSIMPFVIGSTIYSMPISSPGSSSTSYCLRIYAEDKNYDITVPEQLYERKQVGSRLKVKVYKEKIELLEDEK
uniref:Uncharacterized protein n=1 Tax=Bacillus subtilis TaxID=1423 RepID=A0A1J0AKW8_BACIU|nr:hypothetical protein [Bacillus subtilis]APB62373.1 hypothetical protein pBS72_1040 [Bacillus subtilis]